ncbi:MAG: polyphosphate kinase 2 family protein [Phycisphaerales bacterium]
MNLAKTLRVDPAHPPRLAEVDPANTFGVSEKDADDAHARDTERLQEYQQRLYAEGSRSLLVVLQALDAGGKDGTIRHVFGPLNPQGVRVASFGKPTTHELARDYLWRVHARVPERGAIGVFNRSHYEDVLVVRVANLMPKSVWSKRYDHINAFERLLADEGTTILKFFLHVSASEQLDRLKKRLTHPNKGWKFNAYDWEVRKQRKQYLEAYEDVLAKCSTDHAPWFVVPADHKWFRDHAIARIVRETLEEMDPKPRKLDASPEEVARLLAIQD